MKYYKIVIFTNQKISAKLKLLRNSYEALQESPFNKGAGSEADWGFLRKENSIYIPYNKNLIRKIKEIKKSINTRRK